jgi:hypothetical protein
MIAAIAARDRGRVQIDPVIVVPAGHMVSAIADTLAAQVQAPLQPIEVHATRGIQVDLQLSHRSSPVHAIVTRMVVLRTR